jgi:hypothetical protein
VCVVLRPSPIHPPLNGQTYEVDRPKVIPMAEATAYFRPRGLRMPRVIGGDVQGLPQASRSPSRWDRGRTAAWAAGLPGDILGTPSSAGCVVDVQERQAITATSCAGGPG